MRLSALRAGRPLVPGRFLVLISGRGWVDPRARVRLERLGELKKTNDLIGNRTRDLPAFSIVPQPTTLLRARKCAINTLDKVRAYWQEINPSSHQRGYYIRTISARVHLKKISGRESQGAWRQDELIGGKPPVIKWLWLWLSLKWSILSSFLHVRLSRGLFPKGFRSKFSIYFSFIFWVLHIHSFHLPHLFVLNIFSET
jgi:hypothetical protein